MRSNRFFLLLIVVSLAFLAVPAVADCGADHGTAEEAHAHGAKACCAGAAEGHDCSADCPHVAEAMKLALLAEEGDAEAMTKLVAMVKESGHEDAMTLAAKAGGGCEVSQASLIAMVKEHAKGETKTASMTELAEAAGQGCAKSAAKLIAAAKVSGDEKMAQLAERAEGGCEHSKAELIAMNTEKKEDASK
jgi:hypothetical protein